jgi:hypothetical protein
VTQSGNVLAAAANEHQGPYVLILYGVHLLTGLSPFDIVKASPMVLATLLSLATYFVATNPLLMTLTIMGVLSLMRERGSSYKIYLLSWMLVAGLERFSESLFKQRFEGSRTFNRSGSLAEPALAVCWELATRPSPQTHQASKPSRLPRSSSSLAWQHISWNHCSVLVSFTWPRFHLSCSTLGDAAQACKPFSQPH